MSLSRAYLEIVEGPGLGRRMLLRDEQVRYVGRTSQADDACPENPTMSSIHFSVRWFAGKCELKDLTSANGTWRHGKQISEALLGAGEEFKAGKATFRVVGDDDTEVRAAETRAGDRGDTSLDVSEQTASVPAPPPPLADAPLGHGLAIASAAALPSETNISDEGKAVLMDNMHVIQFLELLASREHYLDALSVMAYALTKRSAVDWACRCIRHALKDGLSPLDAAALAAAEAWVAEPNEENRRQAEEASKAAKGQSAAAWAASAAFWNSGSLSPPHCPVVPPGPLLTAHSAGGAAMLAAVAREPEKKKEKYVEFLRIGMNIMTNPEQA